MSNQRRYTDDKNTKRYSTLYTHKKLKIKPTRKHHYTLLNDQSMRHWQHRIQTRKVGRQELCWNSRLGGIQNNAAIWEDSLAFSYTTKHTLSKQCSSHTPLYLPNWAKNLMSIPKPTTDVYGSFIHTCQNSEYTEMSLDGINKLCSIQTMAYYVRLKSNGLSSHENTCRTINAYY